MIPFIEPIAIRFGLTFENRGHPLKLSISLPLQWVSMISSVHVPPDGWLAHGNVDLYLLSRPGQCEQDVLGI